MPDWKRAETRLRKQLAASVRRIRQEKKLTLEDVSHRAQMHWRHWQKVEAGEVNATLRTLARLSAALGVEAGRLLE